jgi:hypothetical protein
VYDPRLKPLADGLYRCEGGRFPRCLQLA